MSEAPASRATDRPGTTVTDRCSGVELDPRFELYRRTADRDARNGLIEDHRWLARHCARRFANRGEPLEDLVQVAMLGILKAVDRFDPSYGTQFTTFAMPTVIGELRRHFRDKTWAVHVPRRAKELHLIVADVIDELHQLLGRSPSIPEIADHAGITVEGTLQALEANNCYRSVPLAPTNDNEDTPDAVTIGADEPGYSATDTKMTIGTLLSVLATDRERQIIKMRFVDGLTQSQIANEIGVSQVQVSRLLRASLDKMRRQLAIEPAV
jgi:RNA polymerase sigma-B factor